MRWPARLGGLLLVLSACGTTNQAVVGQSTGGPPETPIELALRRPAGDWIHVGDLRGRPVLLFVFATYDPACQAALRPLSRFARHHPDVHVIGVAAQPDAELLVDAYESALTPGFPLTYDPEHDLRYGTSPLGRIAGIPLFIMLDASGFEVGRYHGFPSSRSLDMLLERARARGGEHEPATDVPLLAD